MNGIEKKLIPNKNQETKALMNDMVRFFFGWRNRKLIGEGIALSNQLMFTSHSKKKESLSLKKKNIDAIAFGLIALVKMRKGILKGRKPIIVQSSALLLVLAITIFRRIAGENVVRVS
ncbi:hypothetical protein [Pedobacter mendelii]|nr:hypothetical protein [Pedobacter mendelii]